MVRADGHARRATHGSGAGMGIRKKAALRDAFRRCCNFAASRVKSLRKRSRKNALRFRSGMARRCRSAAEREDALPFGSGQGSKEGGPRGWS